MIKYDVVYNNFFTSKEETEAVYLNMTKDEIYTFIQEQGKALDSKIRFMEKEQDHFGGYNFIKDVVCKAYGKPGADGRRFEKSEEITQEFVQTPVFDALMEKILETEKSAETFIRGVFPKALLDLAQKQVEADKKREGKK